MTPSPLQREVLTGNTRGRPRRFWRTLIMQVEVRIDWIPAFQAVRVPAPPGYHDPRDWEQKERARISALWHHGCTKWRNATWEDQLSLLGERNE